MVKVHYKRYHQLRRSQEVEFDQEKESLALVLFCGLILAPQFITSLSTFSLLYSFETEDEANTANVNASLCSSVPNGTICCDRISIRSDICIMKGDVRTQSASSSIFLHTSNNTNGEEDDGGEIQHETIRPYTRKWETSVMQTIDELNLISRNASFGVGHHCDVQHDVPAVFFSTGGYTGNVYHEFNDGILPLYITSEHLNKKVVLVILDYHDWWYTKYADVLSLLSDYPPVEFHGDNRSHCFPEAIVGLRIHDELTVDPSLMKGNKNIRDFRDLLDRAYRPRIRTVIQHEEHQVQLKMKEHKISIERAKEKQESKKPKLVIISRSGSRVITNQDSVVKMAQQIGFRVEVLKPKAKTELAKIYQVLNSSDVMIGVHGAAMTHFLFMRPGSVFIQVIPLGTSWPAETYYGEPAVKLGLRYIGYEILPTESSLYGEYDKDDLVLCNPSTVTQRGWEFTKKIYLDRQNVRLKLKRFGQRLVRAYEYSIESRNQNLKL
ncbi:unnamed protein product [Ilex paraguariensis]|uniref:Glycosyltransferase 61 catalytic domain-containing protein n=1 Tax=Ilex paraguariensis TaxID=185542 RepID=A0ABC8SFJ0_9AQUA